jgi:hypothetical protein
MESKSKGEEMLEITKRKDSYAVKSSHLLKTHIYKHIKEVFVTALKCIEIKFGKGFDGYEEMRKEILDKGNAAVRAISDTIDEDFNVEKLPDITKVYFKVGEEGNNNV